MGKPTSKKAYSSIDHRPFSLTIQSVLEYRTIFKIWFLSKEWTSSTNLQANSTSASWMLLNTTALWGLRALDGMFCLILIAPNSRLMQKWIDFKKWTIFQVAGHLEERTICTRSSSKWSVNSRNISLLFRLLIFFLVTLTALKWFDKTKLKTIYGLWNRPMLHVVEESKWLPKTPKLSAKRTTSFPSIFTIRTSSTGLNMTFEYTCLFRATILWEFICLKKGWHVLRLTNIPLKSNKSKKDLFT